MNFFFKRLDRTTILLLWRWPFLAGLRLRKGPFAAEKSGAPVAPDNKSTGTVFFSNHTEVAAVPVAELHKRLCFPTPLAYPQSSMGKPLTQWTMETDDSPVFRYLYANLKPKRHLEFGTWQGRGVIYCLEECDATVWTINIPEGETQDDGACSYQVIPLMHGLFPPWAKNIPFWVKRIFFCGGGCQTDAIGMIGRLYVEKQLGKRVCQIYCDSRDWDISNYPEGFFDSVLIDGGHSRDVVISDTRKALRLLRPGGLIMWHDFCPDREVYETFESVRGVYDAVIEMHDWLAPQMEDLFWIHPSWILAGIRK